MQDALVITSIHPLVNLDVLIGAQVQATVYDVAPFKDQTFVGTISEVKINKYGTYAYFKTPDLVGGKWIKISKIQGFAHYETQKATAA